MQPDTSGAGTSRYRRGKTELMFRAHLDAARLAPWAWLTALWWRVLGKRVRSRAQFAALLAASSHTYQLWMLDEPSAPQYSGGDVKIVALVSDGPGQDVTMRSAADQGIMAVLVRSGALAEAAKGIAWDSNPWLMPLMAGDILADGAADAYRAAAGEVEAQVIYADDDLLDRRQHRISPHFKPEWNAELFAHFDFLTGACMVRAILADLSQNSGKDWAARLVAAAAHKGRPKRLPYVLHHRRKRPLPQLPAQAKVCASALPKVSIIVPTRNRVDLLRTCIEGLAQTDYPDFEVIVVDNGSDDPATLDYLAKLDPARHSVLRDDGPFNFSRLNNRAAALATGEVLCLLNNDIEMLSSDWLAIMVQQALRPEVGAVGARLLYPDGRIQHAGVVMGICGGAAHAHRLLKPDEQGYFRRHALPQYVSAVTAACLVVRRTSFEAVGGLDETAFEVAFNDVDLCMRLNARGWQSLYEPRATLVHHESVSRGLDRDPVGAARLGRELAALQARWSTNDFAGQGDPFHHPHLSRYSERFAVGLRW